MIEIVRELSSLFGPSGWEDQVREYLLEKVKSLGDEIQIDKLGNLHVLKIGKKTLKKPVVLTAYMDEPGFMVKDVTQEGMIKFGLMGGTDVRSILGKTVQVGDKGYKGVVGRKPIHLTTPEERKTMPGAGELYIDIGATDHAMSIIRVSKGDCGVFTGPVKKLGQHQILGKALGRAISCGVLLRLMEKELPVDTWFVFTTAKLVGNRGAYGAAYLRQAEIAIQVDICPGETAGDAMPKVSGGPVVPAMDKGVVFDGDLRNSLINSAKACEVKVQPWAEIPVKGQGGVFREKGAKVLSLCCPVKYLTAPCQAADLRDVEAMPKLLIKFLAEMEETE